MIAKLIITVLLLLAGAYVNDPFLCVCIAFIILSLWCGAYEQLQSDWSIGDDDEYS